MSTAEEIRAYWDADAATYDLSSDHRPGSPAEMAAWLTALGRLLPPAPARVLDCGAGTGFLSLLAARLGHRVTAVDLSTGMLAKLRERAEAEGLTVEVIEGSADAPPPGPFDAVVERHVLWTLPDPAGALAAWRRAAPFGRLVLIESLWGAADPLESLKTQARDLLRRARRQPSSHHSEYGAELRASLPWGTGTSPSRLIEAAAEAGWPSPRLERLRDVEWAKTIEIPLPDRLLGVPARFVICAG